MENIYNYVLKHKWFVLLASIKIGASIWNAAVHDLSKFRPSEWFPYAHTFYTRNGLKQYNESPAFAQAWNHHQKRNKHHYQYWIITWDRGNSEALPMPKKYILEMVADWMGAGRAITGKWEVKEWYQKNKKNIKLHHETRKLVEQILFEKPMLITELKHQIKLWTLAKPILNQKDDNAGSPRFMDLHNPINHIKKVLKNI